MALFAAVLVAGVIATPTVPLQAKAMYNPELFQGDIKGIAGQEPGVRRAVLHLEGRGCKLWCLEGKGPRTVCFCDDT